MFLVSLESSQQGGVHGLGSMAFGLVVQKFLNIEWFLHCKWLESAFGVLERYWWAGFNGIYLVRFGFKNVGDIDF